MRKKYDSPQIEIIDIEIEDAVLSGSSLEDATSGNTWG